MRVLRAGILYADQPADGSTWSVLSDPLGLLIFLLKLHVATSVATFAMVFVLMDRRDEAQLVQFILKFKSVMFITAGLYPAAALGFSMHACLAHVDAGEDRGDGGADVDHRAFLTERQAGRDDEGNAERLCDERAPAEEMRKVGTVEIGLHLRQT